MSELKAGKYQAYPEYKDSRVEWIGQIPKDWDMWKISHACDYIASGTTPKSDDESRYYGGEILWVTTGELRENVVLDTQKKVTQRALLDMPTLRIHPEGSVSIAMYGATIGRLGMFGREATTNQACCVMPPSKILFNKYLFYWLFATRQEIINLSSGGGQPNVNQEKIASLKVSAPEYTLQIQIANFLDHETAKIDTLIEKQQQLIKLLKEKRQAVISHAVTKGLNPQAPMKDSGVEWLGEVPEHWNIAPLKYLVNEKAAGPYGASLTKAMYTTSGVKVYGQQQVISNNFTIGDYYISEDKYKEMTRYTVFSNDVLISVMGTVGKVSVVPEEAELGIINPRLVRYKFDSEKISPHFVQSLIMSQSYQSRLSESSQGSTMEGLNMGILGDLPLVFPSVDEQEKVLLLIKKETLKYSTVIAKAEEFVALSIERRTALISAAVTGKIDVRNWEQPND
ncbi:MAG: restriction endonuclease subunit S [Pseudoalteromonas nigrifaciens]